MEIKFKGKNVFVTGGSGGIGKAIVELFCECGANVFFTYRNNSAAAKKIAAKYSATALDCDISQPNSCRLVVDKILKTAGRIDVLVNNAGTYLNVMVDDPKFLEAWRQVMEVNLNSCARLIHAIVPNMKKNGGGRIINISSIHTVEGTIGAAAYHSSKAGLDGLTRSCAVELAEYNILVNSICPGPIDTPMWGPKGDKIKAEIAKMIPLRKFGSPEDIASAAAFLASDYAGYITGQSFFIDGGLIINCYKQ